MFEKIDIFHPEKFENYKSNIFHARQKRWHFIWWFAYHSMNWYPRWACNQVSQRLELWCRWNDNRRTSKMAGKTKLKIIEEISENEQIELSAGVHDALNFLALNSSMRSFGQVMNKLGKIEKWIVLRILLIFHKFYQHIVHVVIIIDFQQYFMEIRGMRFVPISWKSCCNRNLKWRNKPKWK